MTNLNVQDAAGHRRFPDPAGNAAVNISNGHLILEVIAINSVYRGRRPTCVGSQQGHISSDARNVLRSHNKTNNGD
jgi:hypothetical protein